MNKKHQAFVFDENNEILNELDVERLSVRAYTDYKKLLLDINLGRINDCCLGMIHQNGSISLCCFLKNYINSFNPDLKLIVYKNREDLKTLLKKEKIV